MYIPQQIEKNAIAKSDTEKKCNELETRDSNLRWGVRESLLEMALAKSLEKSEGVSPADVWRKNVLAPWYVWIM